MFYSITYVFPLFVFFVSGHDFDLHILVKVCF